MQALRYFATALALGLIGYWASEAMFWSFPPNDVTPFQWAITVGAYGFAAASALSAVIWSGLTGWRAVFLGGAVMGFGIEGVVVSTMYDAFPFQLVWTPLAWHALVTGLAWLGLHLWLAMGPVWKHALAMGIVGLGGGVFAAYWPLERAELPAAGPIFLYHLGTGAAAASGFVILSQIRHLPKPSPSVLLIAPILAVLLWIAKGIFDLRIERLALLPMLGLTLWAMRRLGQRLPSGEVVNWPQPPLWRHIMALIPPLLTAFIAAFVVRGTAGFGANWLAVALLVPIGLGLWLWLLWAASRGTSTDKSPS